MSDEKTMGQVIQIDEARIRDHLGERVRGTVEETLNAMLEAEADQLCGAGRYERSQARQDTRAGSYERSLQTSAGEVNLKVPKLRRQTFETAIIERYRRRESSVEEALIEMYLAGISVRRVEDITEALWGTRVSPSTVSNLNKKIYAKIETWRNRRIEGEHPYLYLDGIVMKRTWAGEVRNVSLLVASAVNAGGYREILGIFEGAKEDKSGWSAFLRHLVDRGLKGVQLIISDACRGLLESIAEYLPEARWQRCMVHFYRNVFSHVPATKVREVSHMLKAIHAQESWEAAQKKAACPIIMEGDRSKSNSGGLAPDWTALLEVRQHIAPKPIRDNSPERHAQLRLWRTRKPSPNAGSSDRTRSDNWNFARECQRPARSCIRFNGAAAAYRGPEYPRICAVA